jgi:acetoacetyl-CoA synthetase
VTPGTSNGSAELAGSPDDDVEVLWAPTDVIRATSKIGRWQRWLAETHGVRLSTYEETWEWSTTELEAFWSSIWEYFEIVGDPAPGRVLADRTMPGASWFAGAKVNWAENVMARMPEGDAVISDSQTRARTVLTGVELHDLVARARAGLLRLGVARGDRVAIYMPNIPESLIVLLAAASIGAIFTSCPPEFGVKGVLDRFSRIEPKVLVAVDGYTHRGKPIDRREELATIVAGLPSLSATVVLPYLSETEVVGTMRWDELLAVHLPLAFERLAFDHPLYILYSSGTSGPPKAIVHGHGGILVEHTKGHHLHHDLGPEDRFFWYSTTGWVMWNYLMSGLLTGASIVMFDGDPTYPTSETLWQLAAATKVTVMGVGAPFLLNCRKAEMRPRDAHDLSALRALCSTGAPLPAEGFRWVYEAVKPDVFLASISGGTDTCAGFVAGCPILPVTAGEMACRCLGVKVEAFDEHGNGVLDEQGELVVTEPMPSMPVSFWGDVDMRQYRASYFEHYPGVWAHGDWITVTSRGTCTISGRSDATLNRGGVRLGTSDFYVVVEAFAEVVDSMVVHLEDPEGGIGELLLFVQLGEGVPLEDSLRHRIATALRTQLSPRHIPDVILAVSKVPRTLSGKKLEVPVKRILQGMDPAKAASRDALADPSALDEYVALAVRHAASA